jgi:mycobactin peptide synthetase MbtE
MTETLDEARLQLLRQRIRERGLTGADDRAQPPIDTDGEVPPTDGQRRMWFVQSVDPAGTVLNVSVSYRLTGELDKTRFKDAVAAVAARHEILRTTYEADEHGELRQIVHPALRPAWAAHDLTDLSEQARNLRLEVLAQREFGTPFNLTTDAPLRVTLIQTGVREHVLLLVAHHIAWDDASWRVFFTDLTWAYADPQGFAAQAVILLFGPSTAPAHDDVEDLRYWRTQMAELPEPLELPGPDGSVVPRTLRAGLRTRHLSADIMDRVGQLAKDTGATPYMVMAAAVSALIARYTQTDDFLIASPVLNRIAGTEESIGYFGNTVVLRATVGARDTFRELVCRTRDTALDAFAHQGLNLDRVVAEINPDRRYGGAERLARLSFGFREADGDGFSPDGVSCERAALRGQVAQLPLGVMVEPATDGARVEAEYLVEVLDGALVTQMLAHLEQLLESALQQPDTPIRVLDMIGQSGAEWLDRVSRGTDFNVAPTTLGAFVERQVEATPDAVAVVYEDRRYTYRELNEHANRLAHWLIERGIGTEERVAVLLDRSPELVIAALGIAKAGAVYLPVDPEYPAERIDFILADAAPKLILREPVGGLDTYPTSNPTDADRVRPLRPDNLAYVIYTSGSTGTPKGVPVPHAPITEYFEWFGGDYQIDHRETLLQVTSPSFDVSIGELFGILGNGARLVIPRPDGLRDIGYLTDLLQREGITAMHFVPSLLGLFLSLPGVSQWRTLRRIPIGGEALPGELADKFHATFDALLHNFYGPTETVINATRYKVTGKQGNRIVPIGGPKINTTVHLLDNTLQQVPVGVIGEIYIGGTHLARGYLDRPALTAERFVADPTRPGGRLYRTGDLARRNADGDLEFVGRADEQVKVRGFRIELGEVAAAISIDPSVGQCVVVVRELPAVGRSLVAYMTPATDSDQVNVDRVRARVSAALPEYMAPAAYVALDGIPITAHSKIDRDALPEPQLAAAAAYREPSTPTERRIVALFEQLLGRERVGVDDSFFDLGGHSLLATKLVAAIRSDCGVDIGIRDIFDATTVARLAAVVDGRAGGGAATGRPPLVAVPRTGPLPLSAAQLRTWFQYRLESGDLKGPTANNNIPFAAKLTGPCNTSALIAAVTDVVDRHESLRTTYREIDGVPYQMINPPAPVVVPELVCTEPDLDAWLRARLEDERGHVFDLERDWPVKVALLRTSDRECVLSLVVHHIAADHWSAEVLFADLLTAYRARATGAAPAAEPLTLQYADYASWQGELLRDESGLLAAQRDYWVGQLADVAQDTGLRPDFPRPAMVGGAGDTVEFSITSQVRDGLAALARDLGATEFMVLQAAVAVLLHKAGSGADIPLGVPVAGRSDSALDRLIGFFVNILVLRNDLTGNPSLREVVRRAREMALAAYANSELPFDRIVDAVNPVRTLSRNPLFQVVVHVREQLPEGHVIDSGPDGDTAFTALMPTFDIAHADLSFNFFGSGGGSDAGYQGHIVYRTELYQRSTVQRLADWLGRVLEALATRPDATLRDLEVIRGDERQRILTQWSRGAELPADAPQTITEVLEPSRRFGQERIAARCADAELNYPDMHRRSDRFAELLVERGVKPGSLVGLSTRRNVDLIVAMVGIMKAGAGYFPLDPSYPRQRLEFMINDVGPEVIVVSREAEAAMPRVDGVTLLSLDDPMVQAEFAAVSGAADGSRQTSLPVPHPDQPMYLVFTSGSTGVPKGVIGTNRAMSTRLNWQLSHYPVPGDDIRLAQASMTFLEGSMEMLAGLAAGATMILATDSEFRDPEALLRLMRTHSVAQVTAVATLVSVLVDSDPGVVRSLKRLVCSGEPVSQSLLDRLLAATDGTTQLLNNFGATETSGAVVRGPLEPPTPKLGGPTPGSQAYVLDNNLAPAPVGVVGEVYYSGPQVIRGYWKRSGLTATRFVANPYSTTPGDRLYRSGDRARWTDQGVLEFVGRTDHQVKVRGFRVELGEVEAALRAVPGVAVAAARTWDLHNVTTLAGYVVPDAPVADEAQFLRRVRAIISERLPGYMVPSSLTLLDAMPKTESGKLNRPGLPQPAVATRGVTDPPVTETERTLAAILEDLLGATTIGRGDGFFELGGDSILSVQLAARVLAAGKVATPRMIFENPTLAELAAAVDAATERQHDGRNADTRHEPMSVSGLSGEDLAGVKASWRKTRGGT